MEWKTKQLDPAARGYPSIKIDEYLVLITNRRHGWQISEQLQPLLRMENCDYAHVARRSDGSKHFGNDRLLRGRDLDKAKLCLSKHGTDIDKEVLAFIQASQEQDELDKKQPKIMLAQQLATLAEIIRSKSNEESLILDIESLRLHPTLQAYQSLRQGLSLLQGVEPIKCGQEVISVLFSQNGKYLVTINKENKIQLSEGATRLEVPLKVSSGRIFPSTFNLQEKTNDKKYQIKVYTAAFSPQENYLATVRPFRNTIVVWNNKGYEIMHKVENDLHLNYIGFSPDEKYLVMASWDNNTAWIWDWKISKQKIPLKHNKKVNAIIFSPYQEKSLLATVSEDSIVRLWDMSGQIVNRMKHKDVKKVIFSPNGINLATISNDRTLIWETQKNNGKPRRIGNTGGMEGIVFSKDWEYIAAINEGQTVRIWELNGTRDFSSIKHKDKVNAIVFSPDGKNIATASQDHMACVWEVANGQQITCVEHKNGVSTIAFSPPDGRYLATASDDIAQIWEVSTGLNVASIVHEGIINALAFSPDGKFLTLTSDTTVWVGFWLPDDLLAEACAHLTRNLTQKEWRKYMGDEPYRKTCPDLP